MGPETRPPTVQANFSGLFLMCYMYMMYAHVYTVCTAEGPGLEGPPVKPIGYENVVSRNRWF